MDINYWYNRVIKIIQKHTTSATKNLIMSKIILLLGTLLIIVNTIIGLLLSNYLPFNWISVDIVLLINTILLYQISSNAIISNGYKISLSLIFPLLGLTSIILAILSTEKYKDNYYLIGFISILAIEIILFLLAKNIKSINTTK